MPKTSQNSFRMTTKIDKNKVDNPVNITMVSGEQKKIKVVSFLYQVPNFKQNSAKKCRIWCQNSFISSQYKKKKLTYKYNFTPTVRFHIHT